VGFRTAPIELATDLVQRDEEWVPSVTAVVRLRDGTFQEDTNVKRKRMASLLHESITLADAMNEWTAPGIYDGSDEASELLHRTASLRRDALSAPGETFDLFGNGVVIHDRRKLWMQDGFTELVETDNHRDCMQLT